VRPDPLAPQDPEATEVSPVSAVLPVPPDPPDPAELLAPVVTMDPRERLVLLVPPVVLDPQVCRECPASAVPLACPVPREREEMLESREAMARLARTVCVV